jgi:protein-S-isoprenylcysteine O-methyltransferase Ste14
VFVLAYLAGAGLERRWPIRGPAGGPPWMLDVGGGFLLLLGVTAAGWGWGLFFRRQTTTVPGRRSRALVTAGPYRFSRNPMYVGLSLVYLGEAGMLHQAWPVALLLLVLAYLNGVVIPLEEERLRDAFGAGYQAYCAQVRRWL